MEATMTALLDPRVHREGWSESTVPIGILYHVEEDDSWLQRGNALSWKIFDVKLTKTFTNRIKFIL